MAPAVGEVLRWKALADASWVGAAGVGELALPDNSPAEWADDAPDLPPTLINALETDEEVNLRPPVRPFANPSASASLAGSPPSSPRLRASPLPAQSPVRPAASPLPSAPVARQLPAAPSPSLRTPAPAESPVESQLRIPSPAGENGSLNGRRDGGSGPKKVGYVDHAEIIPDGRQRRPEVLAESLDSREGAPDNDYARLVDDRLRFEEYERDRTAFDAEEAARQRAFEEAALQRQLEEDKEAFRRVLEREAAEADAEADRLRQEARREEAARERVARAQWLEREAAEERAREQEAAAAAVEEARVRAIRDRFEEFRRVSPVVFLHICLS